MRASGSLAIIWKANRNHTQGHSSSLATWSKSQRQLVEPRGDKPSAARPPPLGPVSYIYVGFPQPVGAEQGEQPGRGEKNQLLLWKRQPEKNWGCVPGKGGGA